MTRPIVSTVIPMYQSAATVADTVRSVQRDMDASGLGGDRAEIIVVNDGSRDRGPEIVAQLADEDRRIRVLTQSNRGLAGARNTGLDDARGEWVRFLDADDLATPGSTGRLVALAEQAGTPGACGSHGLIDESGLSMGRVACAIGNRAGCVGLDELLTANRMGVGTVLTRRGAIGPMRFDEGLRVCEDWDLWLRLAQSGVRWTVAPGWCGPMKLYRVRRGSLSKNFETMLAVGSGVLRRAFGRMGDADGEGCQRGLRGQSLAFASMRAVSQSPDAVARAAAMLLGPVEFGAEQLAEAAVWGVLLGLGERPEADGPEQARWLGRLLEWWDSMGVVPPLAELAGRTVRPSCVADLCVARARTAGASELVIAGAGHNGMALVDAARRAGVSFRLRDDRLNDRPGPAMDPALGARVQPLLAPLSPGQVVICTPNHDGSLVDRLCAIAPAASVIRWRTVHGDLADDERGRIERLGSLCLAGAA